MFERPCLPHRDCLREHARPQQGLHSPSRADRYHFKRKRQRNSTSAMGECGGWEIPSFIVPITWSVVQCLQRIVRPAQSDRGRANIRWAKVRQGAGKYQVGKSPGGGQANIRWAKVRQGAGKYQVDKIRIFRGGGDILFRSPIDPPRFSL